MTEVEGELVTPTGAAIVAAVKTKDKLPETFEIQKIGIGAGKRQYECPGILRAMIISQSAEIDDWHLLYLQLPEPGLAGCHADNGQLQI